MTVLAATPALGGEWRRLEPGLEWGEFTAPVTVDAEAPAVIRVLRVDPELFEFRLGTIVWDRDPEPRTTKAWCTEMNWSGAINAGMFQENWRSVSLMRDGNLTVNSHVSKDKSVFAFGAVSDTLPSATILDLECETLASAEEGYRTLFQSIRMISCRGKNVWAEQESRNSLAAIAVDGDGRVCWIHIQEELSVHEAVDALQSLPLHIERCMYAEGGAHAQMYAESGGWNVELSGRGAWAPLPVPNVLGIVSRQKSR